ncbi:MAG: DNA/RNA non-specific endonuclease [Thiohalomonadales bacterium]
MKHNILVTIQLLAFVLLGNIANVFALEIHSPTHCLAGCPSGAPATNDVIFRRAYIVSTNDLTKMPEWVAYKFSKQSIGKASKPVLRSDPLLSDNETLEPSDYKASKKVIGYRPMSLVPFASFAGTPYWKDIEYLSNIVPVVSEIASGAWSDIEKKERELVSRPETVAIYVMAGTIFEDAQPSLPNADETHIIPSGLWKIISVKQAGKIKTASFLLSQKDNRHSDYCSLLTSIDIIEERTGLNFFHELNFIEQALIEQTMPSLRSEIGC